MVSSISSASVLPPQIPYVEPVSSLAEPIPVESFEQIMKDLYEIISEEDSRAMDNYSFAVYAERTWRETLSKKIEEEQERLRSRMATEGTITKISSMIPHLFLAGLGVYSLVTVVAAGAVTIGGIATGVAGAVALAAGSLLAIDKLLDDRGKKQLAHVLQRIDNESEAVWVNRISTTCSIASIGLGLGLTACQAVSIAQAISEGVLKCTEAGVHFSAQQQNARLTELDYSMELSSRHMDAFRETVLQLQQSPNEQLQLLMQLHRSNAAATNGIFS